MDSTVPPPRGSPPGEARILGLQQAPVTSPLALGQRGHRSKQRPSITALRGLTWHHRFGGALLPYQGTHGPARQAEWSSLSPENKASFYCVWTRASSLEGVRAAAPASASAWKQLLCGANIGGPWRPTGCVFDPLKELELGVCMFPSDSDILVVTWVYGCMCVFHRRGTQPRAVAVGCFLSSFPFPTSSCRPSPAWTHAAPRHTATPAKTAPLTPKRDAFLGPLQPQPQPQAGMQVHQRTLQRENGPCLPEQSQKLKRGHRWCHSSTSHRGLLLRGLRASLENRTWDFLNTQGFPSNYSAKLTFITLFIFFSCFSVSNHDVVLFYWFF